MASVRDDRGHRILQANDSNSSMLRRQDSDQSMLQRGDSRKGAFREAGFGVAIKPSYLPKQYESELQKESYWEQHILNEFELEDDQDLGEEDLHSVIGDILANDP